MRLWNAGAVFVLVLFLALPAVQASANVESRMSSAIGWINGQEVSNFEYVGFAKGTGAETNHTVFVEDQALVALALSDYHSTHNDDRYDSLLNIAAGFILSARTTRGDFFEKYDLRTNQWSHSGGLYSWDAYAIAGLAAAAYKISQKDQAERPFWFSVETRLKESVISFLSSQREDGAWLFRRNNAMPPEALTKDNALFIVGLCYLGLFESQFGSAQQARYYGELSERTARWLFSMQQRNNATTTFGGFPHSDVNSTQVSEENGEILLGVNTYYSIIGVLVSQPTPSIWDARRVMTDWTGGFAEEMRDSHGGTYNARTAQSIIHYPKTTRAAAWMLQALVDIWINLGGTRYYADAQMVYDWMVGENELLVDLQTATSISGAQGGFYSAIDGANLDMTATTDVTASALYAFVRAGFVLIPEFPNAGVSAVVLVALAASLMVARRRSKR